MDCTRCQIWTQLRDMEETPLHRNTAELLDGIRCGCWWCIRILAHLQDRLSSDLPGSFQGRPSEVACAAEPECSVQIQSFVTALTEQGGRRCWFVDFDIDIDGDGFERGARALFKTDSRPREDYLKSVYAVADNTESQQTWEYITDRLKNCEANHKLCKQSPGDLPTRLIEIREEGEKVHLRLILTSNIDTRVRYISLSHRWGLDMPLRLTLDNFHDFQVEIPQQEMPRKYIDAAVIALRLNIRYIWIDSLCIIQDSSDDWDQESGTMDLVYQQAYCNISATSAIGHSEGLFYDRDPVLLFRHKIRWPESGELALVRGGKEGDIFSDLDEEPLNLRGWVCQERLLSTRNISFTKKFVYFECAEEFSCEVLNGSEAPRGYRLHVDGHDNFTSLTSLKSIKSASLEDTYEVWHNTIEFYSGADITKSSDKLVAVSGIARFFQPAIKSKYLAGLWESNLVRDLCWFSSFSPNHVPDYRAPSWSWASMDGAVTFSTFPKPKELVDIVDTYTVLATKANPYGEIRDSRIRLTGWVLPVFHKGCDSCEPQEAQRQKQADADDPPDSINDEFESSISDALDGLSVSVTMDSDEYGDGNMFMDRSMLMDYFLLPIVGGAESGDEDSLIIACLVLAAVTPSRSVYQRIGSVDLNVDSVYWEDVSSMSAPDDDWSPEELMRFILPYLEQKFQHCKVPSYEGHTLEKHEITLV